MSPARAVPPPSAVPTGGTGSIPPSDITPPAATPPPSPAVRPEQTDTAVAIDLSGSLFQVATPAQHTTSALLRPTPLAERGDAGIATVVPSQPTARDPAMAGTSQQATQPVPTGADHGINPPEVAPRITPEPGPEAVWAIVNASHIAEPAPTDTGQASLEPGTGAAASAPPDQGAAPMPPVVSGAAPAGAPPPVVARTGPGTAANPPRSTAADASVPVATSAALPPDAPPPPGSSSVGHSNLGQDVPRPSSKPDQDGTQSPAVSPPAGATATRLPPAATMDPVVTTMRQPPPGPRVARAEDEPAGPTLRPRSNPAFDDTGLPANTGTAEIVHAPVTTPPATPAPDSPEPADVAAQTAAAVATLATAQTTGARTVIRLDPAELGHVQIRIERQAGGQISVALSAERPETLHLLQHDQVQLHQALDQAGVTRQGRNVTFHLAGEPGDSPLAPAPAHATGHTAAALAVPASAAHAATSADAWPQHQAAPGHAGSPIAQGPDGSSARTDMNGGSGGDMRDHRSAPQHHSNSRAQDPSGDSTATAAGPGVTIQRRLGVNIIA